MEFEETVEVIRGAIDRHTTYRQTFQAGSWISAALATTFLFYFSPPAVVLSAALTFACVRLAELHQELVVMWKFHLKMHCKDVDDGGHFI